MPQPAPKGRTSDVSGGLLTAAIVATAALPVIPAPAGWDVYGVRFVCLCFTVVMWGVAGLGGALRRPDRGDALWFGGIGAFAGVVIVSTLLGYAPLEMLVSGNAYYEGASTWLLWLAVLALASLANPVRAMRRGLLWSQVPVGLVAAVATVQGLSGSLALGGFENSNHIVAGLVLAAPVSLALARSAPGPAWRWASVATAFLATTATLASRSSAGALGVGVAIVLVLGLAPELVGLGSPALRRAARWTAASLVGLAAAIAAYMAAVPYSLPGLRNEIVGGSLTSRLFFWRSTLRMLAERPVLGLGADGFEAAVQRALDGSAGATQVLKTNFDWSPVAGDPHSLTFTILSFFGIAGALAVIAIGVAWALSMYRSREAGRLSTTRMAFVIGAVAWLAAMQFLIVSVQWAGYPAMLLALAIARRGSGPAADARLLGSRVGRAALAVAVAVVAVFGASVLVGNYRFGTALSGGAEEYFAAMEGAAAAQPTMPYYRWVALDSRGGLLDGTPGAIEAFQADVDASSPAILGDVRYMVVLVRTSLDEAYASGRTDLEWEKRRLAELTAASPEFHQVIMENAHLAILSGDTRTAEELLAEVDAMGLHPTRYFLYTYYLMLADGQTASAQALRAELLQRGVPARLLDRPVPGS